MELEEKLGKQLPPVFRRGTRQLVSSWNNIQNPGFLPVIDFTVPKGQSMYLDGFRVQVVNGNPGNNSKIQILNNKQRIYPFEQAYDQSLLFQSADHRILFIIPFYHSVDYIFGSNCQVQFEVDFPFATALNPVEVLVAMYFVRRDSENEQEKVDPASKGQYLDPDYNFSGSVDEWQR